MHSRFAKQAFLAADATARRVMCQELAAALAERLKKSNAFRLMTEACIEDLRALGHDLWSFDESDDFSLWCPNYQDPTGPGIVVTFSLPHDACVEWSGQ